LKAESRGKIYHSDIEKRERFLAPLAAASELGMTGEESD